MVITPVNCTSWRTLPATGYLGMFFFDILEFA